MIDANLTVRLRQVGRDALWPFLGLAVFLTLVVGPLLGSAITLIAFLILYSFQLYWKYLLPLLVTLWVIALGWDLFEKYLKPFWPVFFVVVYYCLVVCAALLILYLAVRVVRVAWRHGG